MGLLSLLTRRPRLPRDGVNLASPEFKANPFAYYARLRAEAPVFRTVLPTNEIAWLVTRYDDVAMVLKDERFVKDTANAMTPEQLAAQRWFRKMFKALKRNMLERDPPDHTRLRALVSSAFTPRLIEQMRPRIERLADELLDAALARASGASKTQPRSHFGANGQPKSRVCLDVIRDFALPLPTTIIAEMLGVPVADRRRFHQWSSAIVAAGSSTWGLVKAVPNVLAIMRYIRKIIKGRRANPRDDLVSALVRAEQAGDKLSEDESVAMVFLLLVAGHETTVNLIGNGLLALLEHPAQLEKLRNDPALIRPAIEEMLRYASPAETATERYAREDVTVGGVTIPRGEMVFAVIASANRDERQFANPDALDITREPNRHLSFGLGTHFCLGAPLARLEGQIAINTLLSRLPQPKLAVAPSALRWRRGLVLRGLESLPVENASEPPMKHRWNTDFKKH